MVGAADRRDESYRGHVTLANGRAGGPGIFLPAPAITASARGIDQAASAALHRLGEGSEAAQALSARAPGVLVFPRITKTSLFANGQEGEGVLRAKGAQPRYFRIASSPFRLKVGAQAFGLAMFFTTPSALECLEGEGWSIGAGARMAVAEPGMPWTIATALDQDVYAMPFGRNGPIAAFGLEGARISRIFPVT